MSKNSLWLGKWNYRPNFFGKVDRAVRDRFKIAHCYDDYDVVPLELNSFERLVIEASIIALNKVFARFGIDKIPLSVDQVFVLEPEEFAKKVNFDNDDMRAKARDGFAYIQRIPDKLNFICDVTHELAHLASFYGLRIEVSKRKVYIHCDRAGYAKWLYNRWRFVGLDEAATEMIARMARKELADIGLSESEKQTLCEMGAYANHVIFLKGLLDYYQSPFSLMLKSYMDGSDDFFRALDEKVPHSRRALWKTCGEDKSLNRAVEEIAGKEVLKRFEKAVRK